MSNLQTQTRSKRLLAAISVPTVAATLAVAQLWPWTPEEIIESTSAARPPEEIVAYPDFSNEEDMEWADYAIQNPGEAGELIEEQKTPEQKTLDEWKRLAILDPDGYRQAWAAQFGDSPYNSPEFLAAREEARRLILNPRRVSAERDSFKTLEELRREELDKFAILRPREFNELVKPFKTQGHLDQEALAAYALEHPEEFTAAAKRAWQEANPTTEASPKQGGSDE